MRRLVTGTALALALGGSAQAAIEDVVPALRAACKQDPRAPEGYGLIRAADVIDALEAELPIPGSVWGQGADRMAARAMLPTPAPPEAPKSTDDKTLERYREIVKQWSEVSDARRVLRTLEPGEIRIEPTGEGAKVEERVAKMFASDPNLLITCRNPQPELQATVATTRPAFVLVKQASDLADSEVLFDNGGLDEPPVRSKRTFAEFTYTDDREARVQTWAVKLAAALQWPEQGAASKEGEPYLKRNWRVFLAYDRQGENDPNADGYVNNLDFGAQVSGRFGFGVASTYTGYYAVSGAYRTDDDLESSGYALELAIDPPLPYLPYHRAYRALDRGGPVAIDFKWAVNLVADWVQIDDAGRRKDLADQAEFFRVGYDAGFNVRFGPSGAKWRLLLSTDYNVRDGQTKDGGDAQMFTSSLLFLDSKDTPWSFGLSYERGENLQSFEKSELWKFLLGVRF